MSTELLTIKYAWSMVILIHKVSYMCHTWVYLSAVSETFWQPRRLRDFRNPPHLLDKFSTTGPCIRNINFVLTLPLRKDKGARVDTIMETFWPQWYGVEWQPSCRFIHELWTCTKQTWNQNNKDDWLQSTMISHSRKVPWLLAINFA